MLFSVWNAAGIGLLLLLRTFSPMIGYLSDQGVLRTDHLKVQWQYSVQSPCFHQVPTEYKDTPYFLLDSPQADL